MTLLTQINSLTLLFTSVWLSFMLCRISGHFPQWLQIIWTIGHKKKRNVYVAATNRVSTTEDMKVCELF